MCMQKHCKVRTRSTGAFRHHVLTHLSVTVAGPAQQGLLGSPDREAKYVIDASHSCIADLSHNQLLNYSTTQLRRCAAGCSASSRRTQRTLPSLPGVPWSGFLIRRVPATTPSWQHEPAQRVRGTLAQELRFFKYQGVRTPTSSPHTVQSGKANWRR